MSLTLRGNAARLLVVVAAVAAATTVAAPAQAFDDHSRTPRFAIKELSATAFQRTDADDPFAGNDIPMPASGSHDSFKFAADFDHFFRGEVNFGNLTNEDTPRKIQLTLPPYLTADLNSVGECPGDDFVSNSCGQESSVGGVRITTRILLPYWISFGWWSIATPAQGGIFKLAPEEGDLATLGARPGALGLTVPIKIHVRVDNDDSHRIVATVEEIPNQIPGLVIMVVQKFEAVISGSGSSGQPLLSYPAACDEHARTDAFAVAYNGRQDSASSDLRREDCAPDTNSKFKHFKKSNFTPSLTKVEGDNNTVDTPSAYDVSVKLPRHQGDANYNSDQAQSAVKDIDIALQPGIRFSPGVVGAKGKDLESCSITQFKSWDQSNPAECPEKSELGQVTIKSNELGTVPGKLYFGWANQSGDKAEGGGVVGRIWLEASTPWGAKSEDTKFRLKTWGSLNVDGNGQVHIEFKDQEPLSWSEASLHLNSAAGKKLLVNPPDCDAGNNISTASLNPWTNVGLVDLGTRWSSKQLRAEWDRALDPSGACPSQRPFKPTLDASLSSTKKSTPTALSFALNRNNLDDQIHGFKLDLPEGTDAPSPASFCNYAEVTAHSCDKKVGTVTAQVGFGSELTEITGNTYLVAPLGDQTAWLVTEFRVKFGPIDLGYEYLSSWLRTDTRGAKLKTSIDVDRLPRRFNGIDVPIRHINFKLDDTSLLTTPGDCDGWVFNATMLAARGGSATSRSIVAGCS